jgi:hypothetical protein
MLNNRMSERETVVELPWAADKCPWVGKRRTVLPLTVGISETVWCNWCPPWVVPSSQRELGCEAPVNASKY